MAFATYLRTRPAMRKVELEGESALWAQIRLMQADSERSHKECEERIDRLTKRYEEALAKSEAQTSIMRHERNNYSAGLKAFLTMVKRLDNPELANIAEAVEDMIVQGENAIAIEKGAAAASGATT